MEGFTSYNGRATDKQFVALSLSTLQSSNSLSYANSRARLVPSLTSTGYGLPPTATIAAARSLLSSLVRPSRLEPRTFEP